MSDKIDIAVVSEVIKQHKLDPVVSREIIEELMARIEAKEAEKPEPTPRGKTQYVVATIPGTSQAYVFQIPEVASPHTIVERIDKAAHAFNASKKGRMLPVKTRAEAIEAVPRRYWKEADATAVKTKVGVALVEMTNKLTEAPSA